MQVDQDSEPGAFSVAFYSDSGEDDVEQEDEEMTDQSAQAMWADAWPEASTLGSTAEERFRNLEESSNWFGQQYVSAPLGSACGSASEALGVRPEPYMGASKRWHDTHSEYDYFPFYSLSMLRATHAEHDKCHSEYLKCQPQHAACCKYCSM